ncbi:unnamed protein product [Gordionus sp. m RMFG-2023]
MHILTIIFRNPQFLKNYSTSIKNKLTSINKKPKRVLYEVENDIQKLCNYACGANYIKDQPVIPLKPDSEYPDWLWNLNLGKPKPIEELDPETYYYWFRVRKLHKRRNLKYMKLNLPKG